MKLYELEKLMGETRRLAADYYKLTGSVLPVSSELACFDVARILAFKESHPKESGIDFIGTGDYQDQLIQVKSKVVFPNKKYRHRLGQLNFDSRWQQLVLVIFDESYNSKSILMASKTDILSNVSSASKASISLAKFKKIASPIWHV